MLELVYIVDRNQVVVAANTATAAAFPQREILGKRCFETVHDACEAPGFCPMHAASGNPAATCFAPREMQVGDRWFEARHCPVKGPDGAVAHVLVVLSDCTQRRQAQEALSHSEARLAEAQRIAHLGNWDWDVATNGLYWSDEIYRIFGLEPQQLGATYDAFRARVHPDDREMVADAVNRCLGQGVPYSIDHRISRPDGTERIVHEQAEVFRDPSGRPVRMAGTVEDVTESRLRERNLKDATEKLRMFALDLSMAEEKERRRIASEIHDRLGQGLAMCRITASLSRAAAPGDAAAMLAGLVTQLDSVIAEARSITWELCPAALYDHGVKAALEPLAVSLKPRGITFSASGDDGADLPVEIRVALFKSLRECVNNIVKHARATSVAVTLARQGSLFVASVTDDGVGFDPALLPATPRQDRGFGLYSIRERLAAMGGRLDLESAPGKGTTALLTVPISAPTGARSAP
jgi:PAS domain S-box-containing protein